MTERVSLPVLLLVSTLVGCAGSPQQRPVFDQLAGREPTLSGSAHWECRRESGGLWECVTAVAEAESPVTGTQPTATVASDEQVPRAPVDVPAVATSADDRVQELWLVQVGAFRSRSGAESAQQVLQGAGCRLARGPGGSDSLYLLVCGAYDSHSAARQAAATLQSRYPGSDYWIRSGAGVSWL